MVNVQLTVDLYCYYYFSTLINHCTSFYKLTYLFIKEYFVPLYLYKCSFFFYVSPNLPNTLKTLLNYTSFWGVLLYSLRELPDSHETGWSLRSISRFIFMLVVRESMEGQGRDMHASQLRVWPSKVWGQGWKLCFYRWRWLMLNNFREEWPINYNADNRIIRGFY